MFDMNKMTQRAQQAVQGGRELAVRLGHQQVDVEHLLLELIAQEDGLVPRLLERMGVGVPALRARVEEALERRPRVSGDTEAGKIYVTQALNELLVRAADQTKRLKDDYVSVEHLLLAMLDNPAAAQVLRALPCADHRPERPLGGVRAE